MAIVIIRRLSHVGNFDKRAYDKAYNNANRTCIKLSVSKEEYELFMQSVQKAGITCTTSTYLKRLVNKDFTERGLDPIFKA